MADIYKFNKFTGELDRTADLTETIAFNDLSDMPGGDISVGKVTYTSLDPAIPTPTLDLVLTAGDTSASNNLTLTNGTLTADTLTDETATLTGGALTALESIHMLDSKPIYQGVGNDYSQYFDGTNQNFDLTSGVFNFNTTIKLPNVSSSTTTTAALTIGDPDVHNGFGGRINMEGGIAMQKTTGDGYIYTFSVFDSTQGLLQRIYTSPGDNSNNYTRWYFDNYVKGSKTYFNTKTTAGDTTQAMYFSENYWILSDFDGSSAVYYDRTTNEFKLRRDNGKLIQGEGDDYSQYFDGTNQNFDLTSGDFVFTGGNVGIGISDPTEALTIGNAGKLQVNSAGDDKNIQIYHDDTDAKIVSSSGDIHLNSANNIDFSAASETFNFGATPGTPRFQIDVNDFRTQTVFRTFDSVGNQIVIASLDKNYDHALQPDPTLFIHSDTDPDTNNTQWLSLSHDKTNARIEVGTGSIKTNATFEAGTLTDGTATLTGGALTGLDSLVVDTTTLVVNATGYEDKVGIGTATPSEALTIGNGGKLQVNSAGDDKNIQIYHDDTDGYIDISAGALLLAMTDNSGVFFNVDGTNMFVMRPNKTTDELRFAVDDELGNQLVFTNFDNRGKDHNHGVQTNPTLYIHSDTSPDSNNTQWLSLAHDKTDGVIAVGTGSLVLPATIVVGSTTLTEQNVIDLLALLS